MRNIRLAYALTFFKNSWFWLGIWVFYYLKFTNYAGIGLIETIMIVTMTTMEIPTGVLADLLGKKYTLFVSFALQAVGGVMMAMTPNFGFLIGSVFVMSLGGTLYSGTLDALVYDSLKEVKKESLYDKVVATIGTIQLIAPAVCGIIGGFLYTLNPTFPFWAAAGGYLMGGFLCIFLIEPKIDSIKFSLANFAKQTKEGFWQLFKNIKVTQQTILLVTIMGIVSIFWEMIDSFLGVEFGFNPVEIGVLFSVMYVVGALASQLTPWIKEKLGVDKGILVSGGLMAVTYILTPLMGLVTGGGSLVVRSSLQSILGNFASIVVNENTESKYRATTISTFNMLKNIPYVMLAFVLGGISDTISAKNTTFILGIVLLILLIGQEAYKRRSQKQG